MVLNSKIFNILLIFIIIALIGYGFTYVNYFYSFRYHVDKDIHDCIADGNNTLKECVEIEKIAYNEGDCPNEVIMKSIKSKQDIKKNCDKDFAKKYENGYTPLFIDYYTFNQ